MSKKPNHYSDVAVFYDHDATEQMNQDIPFYIRYAKERGAKRILDLCCGTGRVAIEMAKAGFCVTALDISSAMLGVFRGKLANLSPETRKNISIVYTSATSFDLGGKFDLIIIPYRSFQQFAHVTEAESCLKCVHRHLADGGTFILTCYRPHGEMDENWVYPKKLQWKTFDEISGRHITKYHWGEKIDTERQLIYPVLCYEVTGGGAAKETFYEDLTLKYYYHGQLADMLGKAGFLIEEEYGDYEGASVGEGTELIFVCRKAEQE